MTPIRFAVLTVSDRCSAGAREDASGPGLVELLTSSCAAECVSIRIVPDEREQIAAALRDWADADAAPDLVLTTGGTGLAPRDVTPEATLDIIDRRHDALLELAKLRCFDITPKTYLSRGIAGTRRQTLFLNLPGSPRGSHEWLAALTDLLPHAIETIRGDVTDG